MRSKQCGFKSLVREGLQARDEVKFLDARERTRQHVTQCVCKTLSSYQGTVDVSLTPFLHKVCISLANALTIAAAVRDCLRQLLVGIFQSVN